MGTQLFLALSAAIIDANRAEEFCICCIGHQSLVVSCTWEETKNGSAISGIIHWQLLVEDRTALSQEGGAIPGHPLAPSSSKKLQNSWHQGQSQRGEWRVVAASVHIGHLEQRHNIHRARYHIHVPMMVGWQRYVISRWSSNCYRESTGRRKCVARSRGSRRPSVYNNVGRSHSISSVAISGSSRQRASLILRKL